MTVSKSRVFIGSLLVLLLLTTGACDDPAQTHLDPPAGEGRFELVVLGVAQDGGLPHLGCSKTCCERAREEGRREGPASLGIHDTRSGRLVLVEATPDIEAQVALLHEASATSGAPRRPFDALLLTHAHIGHYAGLVHLGREVASTKAIDTWLSPRFAEFLSSQGPWSQLVSLEQIVPRTHQPGTPFEPIEGLSVEALPVPHRDEFADTVAYRFRGSHRTVLFVPDIDRWEDDILERLLEGVDIAYLDATFYDGREVPGRDISEIPHPPMVLTMDLLGEWVAERPAGSVRFIHLNHSNPALHEDALRDEIAERGYAVASRGETLRF
jgi:pyrroloquinoline quinone biosynthesis protein B